MRPITRLDTTKSLQHNGDGDEHGQQQHKPTPTTHNSRRHLDRFVNTCWPEATTFQQFFSCNSAALFFQLLSYRFLVNICLLFRIFSGNLFTFLSEENGWAVRLLTLTKTRVSSVTDQHTRLDSWICMLIYVFEQIWLTGMLNCVTNWENRLLTVVRCPLRHFQTNLSTIDFDLI